ncbi:hypothetical protein [Candidatus Ichthyocystis sparus]|uniref:hypothetical protein n=2 Tax=Candidatus Ichthyocystis sparus TaxID=1561004 RepID=UPI001146DCAB|nr:hypothetical protein [Candidatus Ichthyocystis sparus]
MFEFYRDKILLRIYENIPGVVPQVKGHAERVIESAFSITLDSYIDNIFSMKAAYRFLKCPDVHLSCYTEDRFLSESSMALLRAELELLTPYFIESITETVSTLTYDKNKKSKRRLFTADLISLISYSIEGSFCKCVPIFLELITSCEILKKVFFQKDFWF